MEVFAMGPGRDRDGGQADEPPLVSLEPLELGVETDAVGETKPAAGGADGRRWPADLVRADVLAVTSAAAVVVAVLGLPFTQFLSNLYFIPVQISSAWTFLPILVAAGTAALFGMGAVRQASRQDAATWVRVVAGTGALLGSLLFVGTAIIWLYAVESGLFDELGRFF